jgi:mediator of RNA polymerase II transcription subunit 8
MLSHDKSPPLRNLTVLPLLLSPDRDDELLRLTEGRVPTFSHDLVPDYLRTKPEPDVERQMIQMEHKAANLAYESAQVCISACRRIKMAFNLIDLERFACCCVNFCTQNINNQ